MLTRAQCQQWLVDLRSGKFQQGKHRLCQIDLNTRAYCCLGVLGQQLLPEKFDEIASFGSLNVAFGRMNKAWAPPLPSDLSLPGITGTMCNAEAVLTGLNDSYDWTFDQIADYIEQHLLPQLKD